jgi:BR serine/threonine kinase
MDARGSSSQVGDFVFIDTLGTGSLGKVKLAEHKHTGRKAAIKIIKKALLQSQPNLAVKIQRDISLMRLLDNPHLLRLIEFSESAHHLYIILEYAEHGQLFDYLSRSAPLPVDQAMFFFRQIIYGLEFLHHHGICHRDLKLENILLDQNETIKIGDFGYARWMRHDLSDAADCSPHYAAPEILAGRAYDGRKSDIWSAGVIFFSLLSGRMPFDDASIRGLVQKVKAGAYDMPQFPDDVKDLVQRLLDVNPATRITLPRIKSHSAFRRDLPELYIVPSPLPIPTFSEPIDPGTLGKDVVDVLHQLGYEKDGDLFAELRAMGHTMAKVFVMILTNQLSFDTIPWHLDGVAEENADSFMFAGPKDYADWAERRGVGYSLDSFSNSVIERTLIADDLPSRLCSSAQEIEVFVPLESLMTALQHFLNEHKIAWFHPDEWKIIARTSGEPMVIEFSAEFELTSQLKLIVSLPQGNPADFDAFIDQIRLRVEGIVPI